ncbi:hypothetical protein PG996_014014 [Apiospora saccharicola]|uniref:RRM domain-containing protein n=1 Tax=Apiospora saccharicola TaxID=335842 RepID=A0ABR1TJ41_9PEZI
MDQKSLLEELREGSTPLPPIRTTRPELAPGWGKSLSEVHEAFRNSASQHTPSQRTPSQLDAQAAPFEPKGTRIIDRSLAASNDELLAPVPEPPLEAKSTLRYEWTGPDPDRKNCCLLVTGLPRTVTVTEFIREIEVRRLGKIAAVFVMPPTPRIRTAAVKVTMWDRARAERLMNAVRWNNFGFDGYKVTGHPNIVAPSKLLPWFEGYFRFAMDQIVVNQPTPEEMTVVYNFSSYLGQAHAAYLLLRRTYTWEHVACFYRKDPCEPDDNDLPLSRRNRRRRPKKASQQQGSLPPTPTSENLD